VVLVESSEGFNMELCFEDDEQVLVLNACRLLMEGTRKLRGNVSLSFQQILSQSMTPICFTEGS
jgi:hypothetical protein